MTEQTHNFQAEVTKLLHIVTNSLYSEREVFLRELISNASDACDRLRYLALTEPDLVADDPEFAVTISLDEKARTLTVADNGVGMNRDDLIENLGTIAKSGTSGFFDQLTGDAAKDMQLIGQFGVGFYSVFMVADKVVVESRRAGEEIGWTWMSDGASGYTLEEAARQGRGTSVTLHLKKDAREFLQPARLMQIIRTYADHISLPIRLIKDDGEAETVNAASALWTRPKSEITADQYTEFYRHVGHAFDEPWLTLHARVEGKLEYTLLLFVPTMKPFDLFNPERRSRVKLYVKRVFITDECEDLLPSYLRFLRGIVDSEDLPLNVSREMLQNNPMIAKIRQTIVKRVLTQLEKKAEKEPEAFNSFWDNFGAVLKEGIYEDPDNSERILKLARFHTTAGDDVTSLEDYVARMKDGQEAIYYLTGDRLEAIAKSPHLEGFRAKGIEVLLLADPIDDFWLTRATEFSGKPFKSVTRVGTDLEKVTGEAEDETETATEETPPQELGTLIALIKQTLGDSIKDVRTSERLRGSPVCLVADENDMDMHMERILRAHRQMDVASQRIMEINARHPLIAALAKRASNDGASPELEDAARLLLDQAMIVEGEPLQDPADFVRRVADMMTRGLAPSG